MLDDHLLVGHHLLSSPLQLKRISPRLPCISKTPSWHPWARCAQCSCQTQVPAEQMNSLDQARSNKQLWNDQMARCLRTALRKKTGTESLQGPVDRGNNFLPLTLKCTSSELEQSWNPKQPSCDQMMAAFKNTSNGFLFFIDDQRQLVSSSHLCHCCSMAQDGPGNRTGCLDVKRHDEGRALAICREQPASLMMQSAPGKVAMAVALCSFLQDRCECSPTSAGQLWRATHLLSNGLCPPAGALQPSQIYEV